VEFVGKGVSWQQSPASLNRLESCFVRRQEQLEILRTRTLISV
jgi:hypothetical protein